MRNIIVVIGIAALKDVVEVPKGRTTTRFTF